jgi:thiamine pyrophosphokinase
MSSHHVIRENQEPAVVLVNPDAIQYEMVGQLLEWSPLVIVHEDAFDWTDRWHIKVDAFWVDSDFFDKRKDELSIYAPYDVIPGDHKELKSYLQRKKVSEMYWFDVAPPHFTEIPLYLMRGSEKGIRLQQNRFEKWLPEGSVFRVEHKGANAAKLSLPDLQREKVIEVAKEIEVENTCEGLVKYGAKGVIQLREVLGTSSMTGK